MNNEELKVDTKVIVWDDPEDKYKRYFSYFKDNTIYCFLNGSTQWSSDEKYSISWDNWELADEEI